MRKTFALTCLLLVSGRLAAADDKSDVARLKRELPGTWECKSIPNQPPDVAFIKCLTPTHWSWVVYDRGKNAILAASGGTWKIQDGHYAETIEYAVDSHQHLRGKTFTFTIALAGDKWNHKSIGGDLDVDEVWIRRKPSDAQEANSGEDGRKLQGSWQISLRPGASKAARMIKHVTPTHWTWVAFDSENKQVAASAGGTWSLRGGEYVENCEFTTDNFPQARGNTYPFRYQVDGDRWTLKGGPDRAIHEDQTATRLK